MTAGQRGDSPQFIPVLARIRVPRVGGGRPRTRSDTVLADKAYMSKANRAHLRSRGIRACIPSKADQDAHRKAKGSAGGRPPAFDLHVHRLPASRSTNWSRPRPPAIHVSTCGPYGDPASPSCEWFYVLNGYVRLVLGDQEYRLGPGEAAEFDTRIPHQIGSADSRAAELLTIFGAQGERAHLSPSATSPT